MIRLALLFVFLPALAACLPQAEASPFPSATPTPTASPTASPTATIIWFPATDTPAPAFTPLPSPTPFPLPPLGPLLLDDAFEEGGWPLQAGQRGSVTAGDGELTIVLNEPRYYLSTTRVDLLLTDFFLEVDAATSLCAGADEYGLLLRAASPADFYRFSLSCDGQFRLDLIRGGTATAPLSWTPSAAVPRNAPGNVQIGVWADGDEMHFFLDGNYQASVRTPQLLSGSIGFFARSAGQNAVTVSFSSLNVWSINP